MSDWKTRGSNGITSSSNWKGDSSEFISSSSPKFQNYKPIEPILKKPIAEENMNIFADPKKIDYEKIYQDNAGWTDKLVDKTAGLFGIDLKKQHENIAKNIDIPHLQEIEKAQNKNIKDFPIWEQNPLIHNVLEKGREAVTGGAYVSDQNEKNTKTGLKPLDFVGDLGGFLIGSSFVGPGGGSNALNMTDAAGKELGQKASALLSKAPNVVQKYAPTMIRGAVDASTNTAMLDTMQGKNLKDTAKDSFVNGLGGAVLMGGGKALKDNVLQPLIKGSFKAPVESIKSTTPNLEPPILSNTLNNSTKLDPTLKPSVGATDRTQSMTGIVTGKNEGKTGFKQKLNDIYTQAVDINHPIKGFDETTYKFATNSKKVGGTVSHILNNSLVDMQGKNIGESLGAIAKDIPKNQENEFLNYLLQKHNIDRAEVDKSIFSDFSPEESLKAINIIEKNHPEYKAVSDRLTKFIKDFESEWGNKSGLISNDLWENLQNTYKNYVPTNRSFTELEQGVAKTNGRGFVDQSTPINRATGSDRDVINPIENIANLVDRTVRTARYNEVGQNMLQALRSNPSLNKYAEIIPEGVEINPNVKNVVSVLENGKHVNIQINDKNLLDSLNGLYKNTNMTKLDSAAKAFNNTFKALVTQKNPLFAIRNIVRDIPTAYVNGSESNPFKFLKDWISAGKDLAIDSPIAQQYRALGGETANFFGKDKAYKTANDLMNRKLTTDEMGYINGSKKLNPIVQTLKKANEKIEKINNTAESSQRLAEFKRTLKKGGSVQDALYNSGEITTNFSRGGNEVKKLDNYVPYLNASVQGLDKFARQFNPKNPKQFLASTGKAITAITVPTLINNYMNKDNENYKQLDNRTKDNYYLIPKGDTFIKLPKTREIGTLFGSLVERLIRQGNGDKDAFKGFGNTLATNVAPASPLENNLISPIYNLKSNKDFANRTIVPQSMQNLSPQYQYDEKTSEIAKKIGQVANLSPKQVDYIIKSYTGVIGQLGLPFNVSSNYNSTNASRNLLKPAISQFVADPLYSNQILNDFYDNSEKAKTIASDRNFRENIPSKQNTAEEKVSSGYTRALSSISDLSKQANEASRSGDEITAKKLRAQIIQIARDANNGTFPRKKTR